MSTAVGGATSPILSVWPTTRTRSSLTGCIVPGSATPEADGPW
jgi:hypothetical protein